MGYRQQFSSKLQHLSSQLHVIVSQTTTTLSCVLLKHRFMDQCEVKHNTCSYLAWKLLEFTAHSCPLFLHARYPYQIHTSSIFCVFLIYKQQERFRRSQKPCSKRESVNIPNSNKLQDSSNSPQCANEDLYSNQKFLYIVS
jgi:hypothetical protein